MAEEDLQRALSYFPHALIYPPSSLEPVNPDRRLDERTARMVKSIRQRHPDHVIVVLG